MAATCGKLAGFQLCPPSVLLNIEPLLKTYIVLGACGSIAMLVTGPGPNPELAVCQLAPPSGLLKSPAAGVPTYNTFESLGSIAKAMTVPPSGPTLVQTLVPAETVLEPVPRMANAIKTWAVLWGFPPIRAFMFPPLLSRQHQARCGRQAVVSKPLKGLSHFSGDFCGIIHTLRHRGPEQPSSGRCYGTSTIGARQNANFCAVGSSTLTWHVYRPGCSLAMGTLNLTGSALEVLFRPSVTCSGAVSKAFTLPR